VTEDLVERYLSDDQRQQTQRAFMPSVMFAKRRKAVDRFRTAGSSLGLGVGASQLDLDLSIFDLFDFDRLFNAKAMGEAAVEEAGAVSAVGIGLGAVTMFGSRALGVKSFVDSIWRAFDVLSSPGARKWAAPIALVLVVGFASWLISDLPRAVPHNIGRKLEAAFASPSTQSPSYPQCEANRIAAEVRKVLRLAGYDLRERHRAEVERFGELVRVAETKCQSADVAVEFLKRFLEDVDKESDRVKAVDLRASRQ